MQVLENEGAGLQKHRVLDGIRVIEICDYLSGPFLTSLLGDFGAEVIKVDLPNHIDNSRMIGVFDQRDPTRSPQFVGLGRNKKSVTMDVRTEHGRELFIRLASTADVVVENFRPGTFERWGIGPDVLAAANPRLVLARVSGYGQVGPLRTLGAVDHIGQAFGGIAGLTGFAGGPPLRSGVPLADYSAGFAAAFGIMLALYARRDQVGSDGQVVDVSLYDAFLPMLGAVAASYAASGTVASRGGNHWPGRTPNGCYATKDSTWVMVDGVGDRLFSRLAVAIGRPEWLTDPRFSSRVQRSKHDPYLESTVAEWISERTADEIVKTLSGHGVPVARVSTIDEVINDEHVRARHGFVEIADEVYGSVLSPGPMPHLSATPGDVRTPAPRPGEHNTYVFRDLLGLDDDELARYSDAGAI